MCVQVDGRNVPDWYLGSETLVATLCFKISWLEDEKVMIIQQSSGVDRSWKQRTQEGRNGTECDDLKGPKHGIDADVHHTVHGGQHECRKGVASAQTRTGLMFEAKSEFHCNSTLAKITEN